MIKTQREIQETELPGEEKTEYKTIYDNICTFLIQKKVKTMVKTTPKNIIFYTHYFTFSNHKQLL